jgi:hypothetical protein
MISTSAGLKYGIVVPWHDERQKGAFMEAWGLKVPPAWLYLTQDITGEGCALTKNTGIQKAYDDGCDVIGVLDDDCYPVQAGMPLQVWMDEHIKALEPKAVRMFVQVSNPASRGTPYRSLDFTYPVAASMGFWINHPDFDAVNSLAVGETAECNFARIPIFGRYFAFSGMNFAFRRNWINEAKLINVPRFDDIWMGLVWQKVAYEKGYCFNLGGPVINHVRQSNVWKNLQDEVKYLEINETMWQAIHKAPPGMTAAQLRETFFAGNLPVQSPVDVSVSAPTNIVPFPTV